MKKLVVLILIFAVGTMASASIITSVERTGGVSGDRDWIGVYDGEMDPGIGILADGEYCFTDRTYPWISTPGDLIGAEYVLTFNSDKGSETVSYTVTTSMGALIALGIDDRFDGLEGHVAAQDLVDSIVSAFAPAGTFQDTGLDLFIREREDGSRDRPLSVFAAALPAGTYTFGASVNSNNFYALGAIPEPATMMLLGLGGLALIRRRR